jgi:hypothetical protein
MPSENRDRFGFDTDASAELPMAPKQVIVVGCHPGNRRWLDNMLPSLEGVKYPLAFVVNEGHKANADWLEQLARCNRSQSGTLAEVHLVHRNAFSPGVLQAMVDRTDYDEFCHLHDSCYVKDQSLFDLVFDRPGVSVSLSHGYLMYIGKYLRSVLLRSGIPWVTRKLDECMNEFKWNRHYIQFARPDYVELFPQWTDRNHFVEKLGERRMILEND